MIFKASDQSLSHLHDRSYQAWMVARGLNFFENVPALSQTSKNMSRPKEFVFVVPNLSGLEKNEKLLLSNLIKATKLRPAHYKVVASLEAAAKMSPKYCFVLDDNKQTESQNIFYLRSLKIMVSNPEAKIPVWNKIKEVLSI